MNRAELIARLLKHYGSPAVCAGQQADVLLRRRSEDDEDDRYICTAPNTFIPKVGDTLECMGKAYTVLRCDGSFSGGNRLYTWAVVQMIDGWGR